MYHLECLDEWNSIHPEDLWVYSKLFLNHRLGHLCGPTGCPVPYPGYYIVRPSINLLGMGRFSRIEWIEKDTNHLHPSEFWSEIFEGEHISVDFRNKKAELVIIGERYEGNDLYKWKSWTKIDRKIEFPEILNNLKGDYEWINCEYIDNKIIEVHFRRNPNFRYGNTVAIPVWKDQEVKNIPNLTFIEDSEYYRKGFYIDTRDSNPVKSSDLTDQEQKNGRKNAEGDR
jgi:hypothetical protein